MSLSGETTTPVDKLALALQRLRREAGDPSYRNLAARMGTSSPATLNAVLQGKRVPSWPVVRDIVKALDGDEHTFRQLWMDARTATKSPTTRQNENFSTDYLRQISAFAGQLRLPSLTQAARVKFDDLYVRQSVKEIKTGRTIDLWSMDDQISHAVLLGNPGAGKTTACHALLRRHAQDRNLPTPFLVQIRDLFSVIPPDRSIVSYIKHSAETLLQTRPPEGYIAGQLSEGRGLVIFDGLDELRADAAHVASTAIELFCEEFPKAKVIVTSRLVGYAQASLDRTLFQEFVLNDFSREQITEYLLKWLSLDPDIAEDERQRCAEIFFAASESIKDVYSNPMFLGLAAQVYSRTGTIPRNLPYLIRSMAQLLLHQWDHVRGIDYKNPALPYIEQLLGYLAYRMLDNGMHVISEFGILRDLAELLEGEALPPAEATVVARAFLDAIRERSWMLSEVGVTSEGESIFRFTHRTFMEYFAASHIAADPDLFVQVVGHLPDPEWQWIFEFVLALTDQAGVNPLKAAVNQSVNLGPVEKASAIRRLMEFQQ